MLIEPALEHCSTSKNTTTVCNNQQPFVTVVMPVYNGEQFLLEALQSVFLQTFQNFELIVVDDGSTDATHTILEAFGDRLTLIQQKNAGHAAARNAAMRIAKGDWIAMIDADDIWHPTKLEEQIALTNEVDVVYTAAKNFEDSARVDDVTFRDGQCPSGDVFRHLLLDNFVTHSSVMLRRSAVQAVGGYDETLKTTCDWDLWLRMSVSGSRFAGTRKPLTSYRWRSNSWSRNHDRTCQDRLRVVRSAMASNRGLQLPLSFRQKVVARAWQTSAWFVSEKDDRKALDWYLRSILHRPYSIRGWKEITRCVLHLCGVSRTRLRSALARRSSNVTH